jgi:hypothetical protein
MHRLHVFGRDLLRTVIHFLCETKERFLFVAETGLLRIANHRLGELLAIDSAFLFEQSGRESDVSFGAKRAAIQVGGVRRGSARGSRDSTAQDRA